MRERQSKGIALSLLALSFFLLFLVLINLPFEINGKETVTVRIKRGMGILEIAQTLKEKELINSEILFALSSFLFGRRLIAGEYELRRDLSIMDIVMKMKRGERKIYLVRIVEGSNLSDVSNMLEKNLGIKKEDFLKLARDKTLLQRFHIPSSSIEGYLFPDTYFYSNEIELAELVEKIVERTFKFFERQDLKEKMASFGLNIHTTLTLASLIEKEAKLEEEKPLISAVFHNRLRLGMKLDCDPTVLYGTGRKGPITKEDLRRKTEYNTYTFKGLPPGPICNPGISSIKAALEPSNAEYLYFVSKNDGSHVFSKDLGEHTRYVKIYQRRKGTN